MLDIRGQEGEKFLTSDLRPPASGATRPFDSWDALKLLALLLMFIDHSGHFYFHDQQWLRAIGRGAAPIFLFLGGFAASYRFKWDLFALAVLMSVSDFLLTGHVRTQNILFTILGCRLIFAWLERRGKSIERPWEWFAGSLAWFISMFIAQYGSFGMLFAISGYLKRRGEHYSPGLPRRFLLLSMIAYGVYSGWASQFPPLSMALMIATLAGVYRLLERLTLSEIHPGCPPWLLRAAKGASHYSGYIYAFHLIALEWLTGVPF